MELEINSLEHRIGIAAHLGVPEADYAISFLFKPGLPLAITLSFFILIVLSAVNLDD